MKRNIIKAELINPDRMNELMQRSDGPGIRRFSIQTALFLGSAVGMVLAVQPALIIAFFGVNVLIQFGMFGMLHESCHQTAFKSRNLNLLAGWVASLAQPMTPALMRAFHFEHHRHTHQLDRDPELGRLAMMQAWPRHVMWVLALTGVPLILARFGWAIFAAIAPPGGAWDKVLPFVKPDKRRRIAWEARGLLLIHGGLITTAALVLPSLWLLYAALVLGHAILAFYVTCEHRGLSPDGTILERTRSLKAPALVRWLLWNMPYHAEHHAWPAVPFHALGDLHLEVREHLVHRESPLYLHLHHGHER